MESFIFELLYCLWLTLSATSDLGVFIARVGLEVKKDMFRLFCFAILS